MDINSLYEEIGEHCPYTLARTLDINLEHGCFKVNTSGIYMYSADLNRYYIVLNTKMEPEVQESTCHLLVQQHVLHKGIALAISADDIKRLNRADKATRKYLKVVTEAFLGFSKRSATTKL